MISRIDQAVLLLQDRLQRLASKSGPATGQIASGQSPENDPIEKLRELRKRGQLGADDMRRAVVRGLLADSFGTALAGSLDFQAVADQVSTILSENDAGRRLLDQAIAEMGIE